MAEFVPDINVSICLNRDVDARDERGHDDALA
jgi:hypothetical protein